MATATKKAPAKRSSAKAEQVKKAPAAKAPDAKAPVASRDEYELPVVHMKVPAGMVEVTFWSALGGAALVGMISPPAAAMIGAGVLVARHRLRAA